MEDQSRSFSSSTEMSDRVATGEKTGCGVGGLPQTDLMTVPVSTWMMPVFW